MPVSRMTLTRSPWHEDDVPFLDGAVVGSTRSAERACRRTARRSRAAQCGSRGPPRRRPPHSQSSRCRGTRSGLPRRPGTTPRCCSAERRAVAVKSALAASFGSSVLDGVVALVLREGSALIGVDSAAGANVGAAVVLGEQRRDEALLRHGEGSGSVTSRRCCTRPRGATPTTIVTARGSALRVPSKHRLLWSCRAPLFHLARRQPPSACRATASAGGTDLLGARR